MLLGTKKISFKVGLQVLFKYNNTNNTNNNNDDDDDDDADDNKGTLMMLNLDKTIQSAVTRSHYDSWTLAKYTNNNIPTVHAQTWTNENNQQR